MKIFLGSPACYAGGMEREDIGLWRVDQLLHMRPPSFTRRRVILQSAAAGGSRHVAGRARPDSRPDAGAAAAVRRRPARQQGARKVDTEAAAGQQSGLASQTVVVGGTRRCASRSDARKRRRWLLVGHNAELQGLVTIAEEEGDGGAGSVCPDAADPGERAGRRQPGRRRGAEGAAPRQCLFVSTTICKRAD